MPGLLLAAVREIPPASLPSATGFLRDSRRPRVRGDHEILGQVYDPFWMIIAGFREGYPSSCILGALACGTLIPGILCWLFHRHAIAYAVSAASALIWFAFCIGMRVIVLAWDWTSFGSGMHPWTEPRQCRETLPVGLGKAAIALDDFCGDRARRGCDDARWLNSYGCAVETPFLVQRYFLIEKR